LILIGAKSNKDPRGFIQNGWWGIKFLAIIGIMVAAFFIPNATFIPFGMSTYKPILCLKRSFSNRLLLIIIIANYLTISLSIFNSLDFPFRCRYLHFDSTHFIGRYGPRLG